MLCARRFILAVVVLSLLAAQLIAQPEPNGDGEFAVLIDGLGNYSRPISTKSELAQKFFDQGLQLVYGYCSPEATASFKEALRHDPDNPMLHWGLALALGPTAAFSHGFSGTDLNVPLPQEQVLDSQCWMKFAHSV